jgi:hypothetical protein
MAICMIVVHEATPRAGRPPDFLERTRFMVLLERGELRALHLRAAEVGLSASAFARAAIVAAVAAKRRLRPLPRPDRRIAR